MLIIFWEHAIRSRLVLWPLAYNKRPAKECFEPYISPWNSRNYPSTDNIPVYSFTGHPNSWHCFCMKWGTNTNNYKNVHMFRHKGTRWDEVHNLSLCFTRPALRETTSWVARCSCNAMAELFTHGWLHACDLNNCVFNIHFPLCPQS